MLDSDGSPQRDDRHHRRSRSCSPVSPGWAGETTAKREEWQLAEAAVPVWPPAEQPRAAPDDPEPPAPEPVPAKEAAPAAQDAAPAALPLRGALDVQEPQPLPRRATPWPLARHRRGGQALRGPWAPPRGPPQPQRKAGRAPSTAATPSPATPTLTPQRLYTPKAAFPEGRPRPVNPLMPKRTPPGITLPQLQRRLVQEGGDRDRAGRAASHGGAGRGADGDRGRLVRGGGGQAPERAKARAAAPGDGHKGGAKALAATREVRSMVSAPVQPATGDDKHT